jgi:hypothetical protein
MLAYLPFGEQWIHVLDDKPATVRSTIEPVRIGTHYNGTICGQQIGATLGRGKIGITRAEWDQIVHYAFSPTESDRRFQSRSHGLPTIPSSNSKDPVPSPYHRKSKRREDSHLTEGL